MCSDVHPDSDVDELEEHRTDEEFLNINEQKTTGPTRDQPTIAQNLHVVRVSSGDEKAPDEEEFVSGGEHELEEDFGIDGATGAQAPGSKRKAEKVQQQLTQGVSCLLLLL